MSTDDDGAPPATLCLSPYFRRFVVLTKGSTLPFISTSRYGVLLLSDVSDKRGPWIGGIRGGGSLQLALGCLLGWRQQAAKGCHRGQDGAI